MNQSHFILIYSILHTNSIEFLIFDKKIVFFRSRVMEHLFLAH